MTHRISSTSHLTPDIMQYASFILTKTAHQHAATTAGQRHPMGSLGSHEQKLAYDTDGRSLSNIKRTEIFSLLAFRVPLFSALKLDIWRIVVGCWLLVVGCWLLVVGCWLLVVGCWLLVVGRTQN